MLHPRTSRPLPLLLAVCLAALCFAACAVKPNQIDKQLLVPPAPWLAEPADFGLRAEAFELPLHSSASLTGFWIPHDNGEKRTVVLLHDGTTNASAVHPYYRFLHDAGFQVLVFDARGFGKSKGQPTLTAWLLDLRTLFGWLRARPDVDAQKIALYGTGIGSVAALWAARTQGCQALVLEHLPSPRDMLREHQGDDGGALTAVSVGVVEFSQLPEEIEPDENAPRTNVPALFITADGEPARDRKALVRTFGNYAGEKQLWVLEHTGRAPNGMLTHDGEYQQRIASFVAGALAGTAPVFRTEVRRGEAARGGQTWWQVDVTPPGTFATWGNLAAVEVCAVLADGSAHFARAIVENHRASVRFKLPSEPVCTSAGAVPGAVADHETVWRREPTALAKAGAAVEALWPRIEALRNDTLPAKDLRALNDDLAAAEKSQPFPPELAAELADVWALIGKELAGSKDPAERTAGQELLRRAVASVPAKPNLHVWPGPSATYGWPQEEAVEMARHLLAAPPK